MFKVGDKVFHTGDKRVRYTVKSVDHRGWLVFEEYPHLPPLDCGCYRHVEERPVGVDFTKPVTTRDGRKVRILCTDVAKTEYSVAGLTTHSDGSERINQWYSDGRYLRSTESGTDLINPPVKKYINLFKNDAGRMYYSTREEAEKAGNSSNKANPSVGYIKTVEVEL